jgi:hypothetical protein
MQAGMGGESGPLKYENYPCQFSRRGAGWRPMGSDAKFASGFAPPGPVVHCPDALLLRWDERPNGSPLVSRRPDRAHPSFGQ